MCQGAAALFLSVSSTLAQQATVTGFQDQIVTAPFDGVVTALPQSGDVVDQSTPTQKKVAVRSIETEARLARLQRNRNSIRDAIGQYVVSGEFPGDTPHLVPESPPFLVTYVDFFTGDTDLDSFIAAVSTPALKATFRQRYPELTSKVSDSQLQVAFNEKAVQLLAAEHSVVPSATAGTRYRPDDTALYHSSDPNTLIEIRLRELDDQSLCSHLTLFWMRVVAEGLSTKSLMAAAARINGGIPNSDIQAAQNKILNGCNAFSSALAAERTRRDTAVHDLKFVFANGPNSLQIVNPGTTAQAVKDSFSGSSWPTLVAFMNNHNSDSQITAVAEDSFDSWIYRGPLIFAFEVKPDAIITSPTSSRNPYIQRLNAIEYTAADTYLSGPAFDAYDDLSRRRRASIALRRDTLNEVTNMIRSAADLIAERNQLSDSYKDGDLTPKQAWLVRSIEHKVGDTVANGDVLVSGRTANYAEIEVELDESAAARIAERSVSGPVAVSLTSAGGSNSCRQAPTSLNAEVLAMRSQVAIRRTLRLAISGVATGGLICMSGGAKHLAQLPIGTVLTLAVPQ